MNCFSAHMPMNCFTCRFVVDQFSTPHIIITDWYNILKLLWERLSFSFVELISSCVSDSICSMASCLAFFLVSPYFFLLNLLQLHRHPHRHWLEALLIHSCTLSLEQVRDLITELESYCLNSMTRNVPLSDHGAQWMPPRVLQVHNFP